MDEILVIGSPLEMLIKRFETLLSFCIQRRFVGDDGLVLYI
jgi:hypothetical protein